MGEPGIVWKPKVLVLRLDAMELTPKAFRDVQFREKLRGGYHPEDVDEFLEQAAVAADDLHAQLRQATERAQRAEQAASEASSADETLRKMLVLAQRTADQAVSEARFEADRLQAEARQEADRLLSDARIEAERLLSDSRARAASMLEEAEEQSRRAYEQGMAESRDNITHAEEALRQAQQEAEALRNWVELQRSHLLSVLRDAESMVENAGLLSEPPPVTSELAYQPGTELLASDPEPKAEEGAEPGGIGEEVTGEWDPHYLQGMGGDNDAMAGSAGAAANGRQGMSGLGTELGRTEPSLAFDERALDNFFSDQELGSESRGLGRFRRRQ